MSGEDDGEMGFQHRGGAPPFFGSGWDPIVSLSQSENFETSSMAPQSGFSNFVHYQSGPGVGGNFSEMATSFGLPECAQVGRGLPLCPQNYPPNKDSGMQRTPTNAPHAQDDGASPIAKKKRRSPQSNSPFNSDKNGEGEQQKDLSGDSSEYIKGHDDKKQKIELKGKNAKDKDAGEAPKENYIHMRAKRGQATNSHSLAERVRRERISERMKLLQELVPGCNKITGKAVMLDEIINYVQSLQQQVEFLSMKLATVNPELNNIDLERILSKDILPSRGSNASILGYGPGLSSPHPYPCVVPQGNFPGIPNTSLPFNPMPQPVWDSELQSLLQMEFDSNPAINNLGPNARSKLEL